MSISEDLQTRLSGLTQGPNPAPRRISNREMELMRETNPMAGRMGSPGQGFYTDDPANIIQLSDGQNTLALRENDPRINKLIEEGYRMVPSPSTNIDVGPTKGAISNREMEMFRDASPSGKQFGVEIDGKDYDFSFDSKPTDETIQMLRERLGVKPNMDPGFFAATPELSEQQKQAARRMGEQFAADVPNMGMSPGAISNREMEMFRDASPSMGTMGGVGGSNQGIAEALQALSQEAETTSDPEEREGLMQMIEKLMVQEKAPFSDMAKELAQLGGGEDTALAHLRPGEIVLPPEMMEDPEFESMVENKFNQLGINPEEAVVGMGIASLNESTGLEQFGFFKKIGKKLGKIVKKVAPVAMLIPGVGTALGGALGGLGGLATKGLAKVGLGGIGSALGSAGSALAGGISSLGIPGISSIAGGTAGGFGGITNALTKKAGLFGGGPLSGLLGGGQETASFDLKSSQLDPKTNMFVDAAGNSVDPATYRKYISDPSSIPMTGGGGNFNLGRALTGGKGRTPDFIKAGEDMLKGQYTPGTSGGGGGFGGLGNLAKIGGIGALAAGLGKLAYEDTKNQKGVSLSPVVAMDATGRYNLEAEMARRMGQQAPNPVEFGLLPKGTLPELSGGKPRGMMYGGSVMPMAYADGGNVAMEDFERKNGFIDGPGTETSDDIPAMLSDGEFVMTGQAVRGAGSFDMNNNQGILTLTPNGGPDRDNGTELMYQLMEAFSGQARPA